MQERRRKQAESVEIARIPTLQEKAITNNRKFKETLQDQAIETFRAYESLIESPMSRIHRVQESIIPHQALYKPSFQFSPDGSKPSSFDDIPEASID